MSQVWAPLTQLTFPASRQLLKGTNFWSAAGHVEEGASVPPVPFSQPERGALSTPFWSCTCIQCMCSLKGQSLWENRAGDGGSLFFSLSCCSYPHWAQGTLKFCSLQQYNPVELVSTNFWAVCSQTVALKNKKKKIGQGPLSIVLLITKWPINIFFSGYKIGKRKRKKNSLISEIILASDAPCDEKIFLPKNKLHSHQKTLQCY